MAHVPAGAMPVLTEERFLPHATLTKSCLYISWQWTLLWKQDKVTHLVSSGDLLSALCTQTDLLLLYWCLPHFGYCIFEETITTVCAVYKYLSLNLFASSFFSPFVFLWGLFVFVLIILFVKSILNSYPIFQSFR